MIDTTKKLVQQQFGATAEGYVTSTIHAEGADLARMVTLVAPRGDEYALDIATGGGHTALAFAPYVREIVATDLTAPMLAAAAQFIRGRGVNNVRFARADAEALPFADRSFDLVTVRIAPHHFPQPATFVREVARVLRMGGCFAFDDNIAPEAAELAAFINRVEQWRDPSHIRCLTIAEWCALVAEAGLTVTDCELQPRKRHDFADWTARMHMPVDERAALTAWLLAAPTAALDAFEIEIQNHQVMSLCNDAVIVIARLA